MSSTDPPPAISTQQNSPSTPQHPQTLRIGTRASALALAQTHLFISFLQNSHPTLSTSIHSTSTQAGDVDKSTNLHTLAQGGKSLWTHDLEESLLRGDIDVIVHSLKDVPTKLPAGCAVRSVGAREFPGDVLVLRQKADDEDGAGSAGRKRGLAGMQDGAVIGTSSVRRAAMIRRRYPHLVIKDVRGNVPTRIRKLDDESEGFDALVLAGAGVQRLGLGARVECELGRGEGVLGSVGQGALGVEFRDGEGEGAGGLGEGVGKEGERDQWIKSLVEGCVHRRVEWETRAERSLLRTVEGGCSVPVGVETSWTEEADETTSSSQHPPSAAHAEPHTNPNPNPDPSTTTPHPPSAKTSERAVLLMRAMVVSLDGKECVEAERRRIIGSDADAEEAGWEMAQELVGKGAGEILEAITLNRGMIQGMDGA